MANALLAAQARRGHPAYSVVIPTAAGRPSLLETLHALSVLEIPAGVMEVLVVVDGGGAGSLRAAMAAAAPALSLRIVDQPHAGPAAARNRGAAVTSGDWLIFLDDDCSVMPGFLRELDRGEERNPGALFGGVALLPAQASPWSIASQLIIDAFIESQKAPKGQLRFLPTQCLALRRGDWQRSGGFSEQFVTPAGEDRDFCWRWFQSGRPLVRLNQARYLHRHPLAARAFLRKHFEYGAASGLMRGHAHRAPIRFLSACARLLLRVRPVSRRIAVAVAVVLSQGMTLWGVLTHLPANGTTRRTA